MQGLPIGAPALLLFDASYLFAGSAGRASKIGIIEEIERMNLSEDSFLDVLNEALNETLNETLNASTSEVSEASSAETLITEFVFEVRIVESG